MTVKELIEQLKNENPDAVVVVPTGDYIGTHKPALLTGGDYWWRKSTTGNWYAESRCEGETEIIVIE